MYTKQDIKLPAGDRERRQFLERHRRIVFCCCFFPPSFFFFFFALVAVPWVTVQGVARSNKPASQAGLMFNEDDSQWLLITAMSPNTDTFNTARHSRCFCTKPGGLSTATYLHWCTYLHTHASTNACECHALDCTCTHIHSLRQKKRCAVHHWRSCMAAVEQTEDKAPGSF